MSTRITINQASGVYIFYANIMNVETRSEQIYVSIGGLLDKKSADLKEVFIGALTTAGITNLLQAPISNACERIVGSLASSAIGNQSPHAISNLEVLSISDVCQTGLAELNEICLDNTIDINLRSAIDINIGNLYGLLAYAEHVYTTVYDYYTSTYYHVFGTLVGTFGNTCSYGELSTLDVILKES